MPSRNHPARASCNNFTFLLEKNIFIYYMGSRKNDVRMLQELAVICMQESCKIWQNALKNLFLQYCTILAKCSCKMASTGW